MMSQLTLTYSIKDINLMLNLTSDNSRGPFLWCAISTDIVFRSEGENIALVEKSTVVSSTMVSAVIGNKDANGSEYIEGADKYFADSDEVFVK